MAYVNPLHPPVSAPYHSQYSTLGDAMFSPHSQPQFLSLTRRRLPQQPYTPSSKWGIATGRLNQIHPLISFDYKNYHKQGVSMLELMTRSTHGIGMMIQGANDQVFPGTGLVRIALRILWPGYEHIDWARSIEVNAYGPMTRAQLAVAVVKNFSYFLQKALTEAAKPSEWHLGTSGIRFQHLFLIALRNVFEDVWQADVAVDLR